MLDRARDDVRPLPWREASTTPVSAVLFASVPPLVKTISSGEQPSRAATCRRACATASAAGAPAQCVLDGLPKCSLRNGSIASRASGAIGVVAL